MTQPPQQTSRAPQRGDAETSAQTSPGTGSLSDELFAQLARTGAAADRSNDFVAQNYEALKGARLFSALVPEEMGGGGFSHAAICTLIKDIARACPSTALAFSMHQHLIATLRWNAGHGKPGEKPLRAVAAKELVLVSTGAGDWLASKGHAERTQGGYLLNAVKPFSSAGPGGQMMVTSVPYHHPSEGWQVLHCPVPMSAEGITLMDDWQAMGMRGTGSGTIVLTNVFVPEEAVVLARPRGLYHPFWDVVLTVALPLIMSAYVGLAEAAVEITRAACIKAGDDGHRARHLGAALNQLAIARLAHADMIANAANFDFAPETGRACRALTGKTLVANAVRATTEACLEAVGGRGYYRAFGLERLIRDAHAAPFHPLPESRQQEFIGRHAMGLTPAEDMDWARELSQAAE